MSNEKIQVSKVFPLDADKRGLCEIRFECIIKMHSSGFRSTNGEILGVSKNLPPQWFKMLSTISLEAIKYEEPVVLGLRLKQMFSDLEENIRNYEQFNI
jgi:hypothetical protein